MGYGRALSRPFEFNECIRKTVEKSSIIKLNVEHRHGGIAIHGDVEHRHGGIAIL